MSDEVSRRQKARKILAILRDALGENELKRLSLLDIGSSTGIITTELASEFGHVVGVDIDESGLVRAVGRMHGVSPRVVLGDAMTLPFLGDSFDVVVLNHVYEHVPDPSRLMSEAWRVVKPGRIAYFAADNRLGPIEPHYRLPGLSWLPRRLANAYLRLTGRGSTYYEQLFTLPALRRLASGFEIDDYTLRVLRDPARFEAGDQLAAGGLISKIPRALFVLLYPFIPTYLFVLRKPARRE